ncbi:MAG: flavodoxin domain-containing protein [Verrucomicrobia bacterium]|nr:flavodoxin domain-containing protein [Verrucomicrobiota bacterium]
MTPIPFIPETAPFTAEQRAWLNGFLAGLLAQTPPAPQTNNVPAAADDEPLLVLFGSQTGSAEGLAKRIAKEAPLRGFAPKLAALNDFESAGFASAGKAVIISSTWGDGEPPDNAVNFWSWLAADSAPRLENLRFAVLGLGDKNYSDFCGASKKFDARLEALGAKRLVPRAECDVDYETAAVGWIDGLWEKLGGGGAPSNASASFVGVQASACSGDTLKRELQRAESEFGAPPCAVLTSQGRTFPVDIEYLPHRLGANPPPPWELAADAFAQFVSSGGKGDVLVFMPGGFEISQTIQAIRNMSESRGYLVLPLHGELSPRDQDAAVERYEQPKVIVSTNVAETSITIDGVKLVIDSGLARIARYDANRGINTLLVEKISQASSDQRAGRAGRTAPGRCMRLWSRAEHDERAPQELPEIKRLDLSEVVLTLKAAGVEDCRACLQSNSIFRSSGTER